MLKKLRELMEKQQTLEQKLFWGLSLLLFMICLLSTAAAVAEFISGHIAIPGVLVGVVSTLFPLLVMFLNRERKDVGLSYMIMCIVMCGLLMPAAMLANGGLHSGMPLYCLASLVMCGFCTEKKKRNIAYIVSAMLQLGAFLLAKFCPELVIGVRSCWIENDIILGFILLAFPLLIAYNIVMNEYEKALETAAVEADKKAEMRLEMMNAQLENVADLKRMRHDFRHHNALILEYAQRNDMEGLARYMQQKMGADEYYATKIYCMNAVINNVLTVYTRKAQKEGITVSITAEVQNNINIQEPDLMAITANMMENAVHGTRDAGADGERRISCDIHTKGTRLVIRCSNTCSKELQLIDGFPTARPGTGINSIMNAMEKYDGTISYKLGNGEITCTVILTIPESR